MSSLCYTIIKEINQDAGSTGRKRGIMNTREELEKIINYINGVFERMKDKEYSYQAGAYEVALEGVQRDLKLISEILQLQEEREQYLK